MQQLLYQLMSTQVQFWASSWASKPDGPRIERNNPANRQETVRPVIRSVLSAQYNEVADCVPQNSTHENI